MSNPDAASETTVIVELQGTNTETSSVHFAFTCLLSWPIYMFLFPHVGVAALKAESAFLILSVAVRIEVLRTELSTAWRTWTNREMQLLEQVRD